MRYPRSFLVTFQSISERFWSLTTLSFLEQGEGIQTIDNSISQVAEDVEGGVSELQKASEYQQKFRRKVLIVLIIALILAFIVVFSLYSKLKK
jgi:t-SNARE complex subunit (syntaxin)